MNPPLSARIEFIVAGLSLTGAVPVILCSDNEFVVAGSILQAHVSCPVFVDSSETPWREPFNNACESLSCCLVYLILGPSRQRIALLVCEFSTFFLVFKFTGEAFESA